MGQGNRGNYMLKQIGRCCLALAAILGMGLLAGCADNGVKAQPQRLVYDTPCPGLDTLKLTTNTAYGRAFDHHFAHWGFYPTEGLAAGEAGQAILCVKLDRLGNLLKWQVAQSSGYALLDGTALISLGWLDMAQEQQVVPAQMLDASGEVWLALPVDYAPPPDEQQGAAPHAAPPGPRPCSTRTIDGRIATTLPEKLVGRDFHGRFVEALRHDFHFPKDAVLAKISGEGLYCIAIDQDSQIRDVSILRSSGSAMLDGAFLQALGIMQLQSEMPPLPPQVPRNGSFYVFTEQWDMETWGRR